MASIRLIRQLSLPLPRNSVDAGRREWFTALVSDAASQPEILFTAFEPSGDDHSAAVISVLKELRPDIRVWAWGGPKMGAAGAEIVHRTGKDAVVGIPGFKKIREHQQINKDIQQWISSHPNVKLHIPVDAPAANFPICKIAKKAGIKVLHLVAPQLWAWGTWRLKKLRRSTDLVLCLLPFEETWFSERGVNARFVGHPLYDEDLDLDAITARASEFATGSPKLAILPGSRPAEIRRNFPVMLQTFKELQDTYPDIHGVIAATTEPVRESLYERASLLGGWPERLDVVVGETDEAIAWCDAAVVVSGTVTLQLARQSKPMVIMYKVNKLTYRVVSALLIATDFFTLPNLIAGREVVPELVPYFKGTDRLREAVLKLLNSPNEQASQRAELARISSQFEGKHAAENAARAILDMLGLEATGPAAQSPSDSSSA